jgi:hypothetical protein
MMPKNKKGEIKRGQRPEIFDYQSVEGAVPFLFPLFFILRKIFQHKFYLQYTI